jgi:threonine-phosphate decarboxylase
MEVIMEYQHGGDIYSQDIQMDYSANINPLGMPEAVRQALRDCLEREVCSLYPDSRCETGPGKASRGGG